jgi:hypothetical protein
MVVGAISLAVVGRRHVWGTAAKLKCVHAHRLFGGSSASLILLPGGSQVAVWGRLGG